MYYPGLYLYNSSLLCRLTSLHDICSTYRVVLAFVYVALADFGSHVERTDQILFFADR